MITTNNLETFSLSLRKNQHYYDPWSVFKKSK